MITFRTSAEVSADRRVVLTLPPETPIGKMELVVMVSPQQISPQLGDDSQDRNSQGPNLRGPNSRGGSLRHHFGTVHSRDPQSADNARIDADLSREYADAHDGKA